MLLESFSSILISFRKLCNRTRLNRNGITSATAHFGSEEYSKEELVAEIGASMLTGLAEAFGEPTVLTIDKAPALLCALEKLRNNAFYVHAKHCTVKHLNNLIGQDHRHIKRRFVKSVGFQNLRHASRTLKGIETIHAIYKQRRSLQKDSAFSVYNELQQLMDTA